MKRLIMLPFMLCILLTACDEEVQQGPNFADPNPNDTEIQIQNKTSFDFDSMYLNTSGGDQFYGNVSKLNTSRFRNFKYAYQEMEIRFKVDQKNLLHIPVSYDGLSKVEPGMYELEIDNVDTNQLSFTFLLKEL